MVLDYQSWKLQSCILVVLPIGLVNEYPTKQFISGISRNTPSKSYMLSLTVSGISKIMHCGIFIDGALLVEK